MCPVRFTSYREFTKHVGVIVSSSGTEHTETPSIVLVRLSYRNLSDGSHEKIQQAIGPHEDLLTIVKRRKLKWYGHASRSAGLAKAILQFIVKEGRRQGKQKKKKKVGK